MQLTKVSTKTLIPILIFTVIFLLTRLPLLSRDEINPDGVNWHYRMQQFVVGLKTGQLEKTYQHYQPGVTLMWVAGIPVEVYKQITGIRTYDMNNFQSFHLVAKASVILAQLLLSLLAIFLLSRIVDFKTSLLTMLVLSLEPFFLGNSRLLHMDVLFTLFLFNALLASFLALTYGGKRMALLSGLLLALSFLTKSIGVGAFVYVIGYSVLFFTLSRNWKHAKKYFYILIGTAIVSLFLFFPALLKNPVFYLSEIFSESARVGVRTGHTQIIYGQSTDVAGLNFYPLVLLVKVSPFLLVGIIFFILLSLAHKKPVDNQLKKSVLSPTFFLVLFYIGYFLVMLLPAKKIDRYMIPLFPVLSYFAVLGYQKFYLVLPKVSKFISTFILALFSLLVVYPDIRTLPNLFTYTSPIFGSTENANKIIAQKPFGIGVFDLKDSIVKRYGVNAKLGFFDVKPIEAIYPNSKVFDIRETGPGAYDYVVLGVNEVMPDKILNDPRFSFEKDYSIWINGLEYWRVYAKKAK